MNAHSEGGSVGGSRKLTGRRIQIRDTSIEALRDIERERSRRESVRLLAASVHLDSAPARPPNRDDSSGDRAQIATWASEGGAARH